MSEVQRRRRCRCRKHGVIDRIGVILTFIKVVEAKNPREPPRARRLKPDLLRDLVAAVIVEVEPLLRRGAQPAAVVGPLDMRIAIPGHRDEIDPVEGIAKLGRQAVGDDAGPRVGIEVVLIAVDRGELVGRQRHSRRRRLDQSAGGRAEGGRGPAKQRGIVVDRRIIDCDARGERIVALVGDDRAALRALASPDAAAIEQVPAEAVGVDVSGGDAGLEAAAERAAHGPLDAILERILDPRRDVALQPVGRIGATDQDGTGSRVAPLQRALRPAHDLDRADVEQILRADGDAAREIDVIHVDRDRLIAGVERGTGRAAEAEIGPPAAAVAVELDAGDSPRQLVQVARTGAGQQGVVDHRDRDRHVAQPLGSLLRGDDDLAAGRIRRRRGSGPVAAIRHLGQRTRSTRDRRQCVLPGRGRPLG